MKKIISFSRVNALIGVALCAILFSFTPRPGAHSVQVYLDDKLVLDQYVNFRSEAPKLKLDPAEKYIQLIVKYSECGRRVAGRVLTLKDDHNKLLKDWRYKGASTGFSESMACAVKDIVALKAKAANTMKLFYSSNDFPEGHQVAYLVISGSVATASK